MSDDKMNFPHSPEYIARQSERRQAIKALRDRATWTNAQFIAERDAAYIAQERAIIQPRIDSLLRDMESDGDTEGYSAFYHTDEG